MSLTDAAKRLKSAWKTFAREVQKPANCPFCELTKISWNGHRIRSASVMTDDGVVHLVGIECRRAKCGSRGCARSWTLLPPGLSPNRHYQLCVVASALSSYLFDKEASQAAVASAYQCSERTMGRWLRWIGAIADPSVLQRKVLEETGEPILSPLRPVENLARKALDAVRRDLLTRAAQVLVGFEALGVAMGKEPPGLRGVLERALGNRPRIATYERPLIPEFAR